jgi:uncharacterized zinc-type alcohol dehydrogenase-like protein
MDRQTPTYGGYSTSVVVAERFVVKVPAGLDPAGAAPLLCAGITTYSPLRQWSCKKGDRVAVVGLGAQGFEVTTEKGALKKLSGRFDLIVDTISAPHDYNAYLGTLKPKGTMVIVGVPPQPTPVAAFALIGGNKRLAGSSIGGMAETQEMMDYCAEKQITADVEVIPVQKINEAYERMLRSDVRYRFVIDMASLR